MNFHRNYHISILFFLLPHVLWAAHTESLKEQNKKLELMYQSGRFDNVIVERVESSNTIRWQGKPRLKISGIDYQGISLFSAQYLSSQLPCKIGNDYSESLGKLSSKRLQEEYEKIGYFQSEIKLRVVQGKEGNVSLLWIITEGKPCVISHFSIVSTGYPKARKLRRFFPVQEGEPFIPSKLDNGMEQVKNYLVAEKFSENRIASPELKFTVDKTSVEIKLKIEPGHRINLEFSGNNFLSQRKLLKQLEESGGILVPLNTDALEQRLEDLYKKHGFFWIKVSLIKIFDQKFQQDGKFLTYQFQIDEGPRVQLQDISIVGNVILPKSDFQSLFLRDAGETTREGYFDKQELEEASEKFIENLRAQGFLEAKISNPSYQWEDRDKVTYSFHVAEGKQVYIDSIIFNTPYHFTSEELSRGISLKQGSPYNPYLLENCLAYLKNQYFEEGFLYCDITAQVNYPLQDKAELRFKIHEGPRIRISHIIVAGNKATQTSVVLREIPLSEGEVLKPTLLRESYQRLSHLTLFQSIDIKPLLDPQKKENVVPLVIRLTEKNPGQIELGTGFRSDEGIRAFAGLNYVNLSGLNRTFLSRLSLNRKLENFRFLEREIFVRLGEPYLFQLPLAGRFEFTHLKESSIPYDEMTNQGDIILEKTLPFSQKISLSYQYEDRDILLASNPHNISRRVIGALTSQWNMELQNTSLWISQASRHNLTATLALPDLGSYKDVSFARCTAYTSWRIPLIKDLSWFTTIQGGIVASLDPRFPIPIEKRFYLGGPSSVRGYKDKLIGSSLSQFSLTRSSFVILRNELRHPLYKKLSLGLFVDGGKLMSDAAQGDLPLKYSLGPTLHYESPLGPIGLELGIVPTPNKVDGESSLRLHFSLGTF